MGDLLPIKKGRKEREIEPLVFTEKLLDSDFDEVYRQYQITEDTTCGFGFFRGKWLQL